MADDRRDPLEESLTRMREAMSRAWSVPIDQAMPADAHQWRQAWKEQRRALREQRRLMRRQRVPSKVRGGIYLAVAGVLTYLVLDGAPFWMLFIALGLCITGFGHFFGGGSEEKTKTVDGVATPVAEPDPNAAALARVDALCAKLLEEIEKGPAVLREVVRRPEETVRGLKDAIHGLARREGEVRALVTSADGERLQRERADLVGRRDAAADPVTRERWEGALKALDAQLQHRETLRTQAARLEAERARLGYTLETLYTQVLAVRSTAASDEAGAQLRESVERLGDEISAVAGAVESMQAVDADVAGPEQGGAIPASRDRV